MRLLRSLVLIAVLAGAPSAALAHASLVGSDPPAEATLAAPPSRLRLDFNEPVSPLSVRLIGPNGEAVTPPVAAENESLIITPPTLKRGTHVLSYRVISADGHPVGGSLIFSVGAPSAGAAGAAAAPDTPGSVKAAIWAARLLIYLGLFVGVGGASFRALIAQGQPLPRRAGEVISGSLIVGLAAALASLGLQGLDNLALPMGEIASAAIWRSALATSYAWSALAAGGAMLAALISLRARAAALIGLAAAAALAGVGLSLGLSGHAATAGTEPLSRTVVFVHGVCIAFWVGALVPLVLIVRDGGRGEGELARFSRLIPLPLALLIASGLYLAYGELDRPDALWTTHYGEVLSVKLAAVLILLTLAAANRYFLVPRLSAVGAPLVGSQDRVGRPQGPPLRRPATILSASIVAENFLVLAILGTVALWRFTPPPRALIAAEPSSIHFHGAKAMAQIEVTPVRARGAEVAIEVLDGKFQPLSAKTVTLFLSNAAAGIEPMRREAESLGGDAWRVEDLRLPIGGRWQLRVDILIDDFDKESLEDDVLLPRAPSG
jgi:copper transport protein